MSSPSNPSFECSWQASGLLLSLYLAALVLACFTLVVLPIPTWAQVIVLIMCLLHAIWVIPGSILLSRRSSWRALRHAEQGWSLWSRRTGWQPVQLRPDSLALPMVVILRYRMPGDRFSRGICIPRGAMPAEQHRRLRLRLKFSRHRWAEPE
ncbi:hypothetical protein EA797_12025 [Stutzerimonas zhaodongensis]|uniref:Toxin CptA n=1 Tax=Stutzerimonas zhaodongensis TaxID=1176257 RepID=A0A3M2HKH4_9GAMM|nr:protein YgfX [Stutzerimonas zhaodongensis]MCQ4315201.1 hypothetical protein [Stutzerimonas zhaodongensis]RMH90226.1 hypothetical protein EA797_12025 [Stutzerimonas zhaodongensis]